MNSLTVEDTAKKIRLLIENANFGTALELLKGFVSEIEDRDLINQFTQLSARYNNAQRARDIGVQKEDFEINAILDSMTNFLSRAQEIAYIKIQHKATDELEKLNASAASAIDMLKKINIIMAESRLLELQITLEKFSFTLTQQQKNEMLSHINRINNFLDDNN